MDKNALILDIGHLIASDGKVNAGHWENYALIAFYADGMRRLSGFRYSGNDSPQSVTPESAQLGAKIDALRESTRVAGKGPWNACVVRINRPTARITVDFEYDAPEQWDIRPATLQAIAERARPQ